MHLQLRAERLPSGPVLGAIAELSGRFDFRFLPEGRYHVSSVLPSSRGRSRRVSFGVIDVRNTLSDLTLRPVPAGWIRGIVSTEQPLPAFQLVFASDDGASVHRVLVREPRSEFEIPEVMAGDYRIELRSTDAYIQEMTARPGSEMEGHFQVLPGTVSELELLVSNQFAQVSGRVWRRGSRDREPSATISLRGERGEYLVRADQGGHFVAPRVAPGIYRICAWSDISAQGTLRPANWRQAGCEGKQFRAEAGFETELDLTAAPW
jgi:hypothetical protein